MAQERSAEHLVPSKIRVLLQLDDGTGPFMQPLQDLWCRLAACQVREISLAQVLQSVAGCVLGELVKMDRIVDLGQLVVQQKGIADRARALEVALQKLGTVVHVAVVSALPAGVRLAEGLEQRARLFHARVGFVQAAGVRSSTTRFSLSTFMWVIHLFKIVSPDISCSIL